MATMLVWAGLAVAADRPFGLSGSLSYNYRLSKARGDEAATSHYISGTLNGGSYVWQPWFLLWNASLTGSILESEVRSSSNTSNLTTGRVDTRLFPRSRFPFGLSYEVTDNRTQSVSTDSPFGLELNARATRLMVQQSYQSYGGMAANVWYNTSNWSAQGRQDVDADAGGLTVSQRFLHHNLQVNGGYSSTATVGDRTGTRNNSVTVIHSYYPTNEFNVNTLVSDVQSRSKGTIAATDTSTSVLQASSDFFWRPEYRSVSMTGGVRFSEQGTNQSGSTVDSFYGYVGTRYQYSKNTSVNGTVSGNFSDSNQSRTASGTVNVGANYTSDTYFLGKTAYNWTLNSNVAQQISRGGVTGDKTSSSAGLGFGHTFQRGFSLTDVQRLDLSFGQSVSAAKATGGGGTSRGLGHTGRISWNRSEAAASTSSWFALSDSRTFGDADTSYQSATFNFSRRQNMSRLSSLSGDVNARASRQSRGQASTQTPAQSVSSQEGKLDKALGGGVQYNHARFLGIYRMSFTSRLDLSQASLYEGDKHTTSRWDNRVNYSIGLLTTSVSLDYLKESSGQDLLSFWFQVTRTF